MNDANLAAPDPRNKFIPNEPAVPKNVKEKEIKAKEKEVKSDPADLTLSAAQALFASGVPVAVAIFVVAIQTPMKTQENDFAEITTKKTRRVAMSWTPHGLICLQEGVYFTVPLAMLRVCYFK